MRDRVAHGIVTTLFSVGARRELSGWLGRTMTVYCSVLGLWVLWIAVGAYIDPLALGAIFLPAMLVALFLTVSATAGAHQRTPTAFDYLLSAASAACALYFAVAAQDIVSRISLFDPLTPTQMLFGTILLAVTLEGCRRGVGLSLTLIVLGFIAYNLWGHLLDGPLGHGRISYTHFLDQIVFTTNGVFGPPLRVAATYAFLFVAFGTFLERTGGGEFFFNLAAAVSGRRVGGPAKVAVFSSALYGTISGSPTADVVTTGSINIPMMRRLGYPPALAAAVEAAASTSGGIMPPVMGAAAFIMVEITGIPYQEIAVAAIIPALLYCLGVYSQVHFRSLKLGLAPMAADQIPTLARTMREGGLFLIPLAALLAGLFAGFSVSYVAVIGIAAVIATAALRRGTRLSVAAVFRIFAVATRRMVPITAACAAAGLVVGGISMTGLSGKFAHLIFLVAGDQQLVALLLVAALCILLGMGMPTPSAYIMAAVLAGPLLAKLGIPTLVAHMFLLYFASMSAITPPVAVAAFAAASIAEANPLAVAAQATRLAIVAFVIPFMFVYNPELLGLGDAAAVLWTLVSATVGTIALAASVEGHMLRHLGGIRRLALAVAGLSLMLPGMLTDGIGILVLATLAGPDLLAARRRPVSDATAKLVED